jgi:integrase/recombinase XerC
MSARKARDIAPPGTLLDGLETWRHEPLVAFMSLLASKHGEFQRTNNSTAPLPENHRLRNNSAIVYEAMFNKFLAPLGVQFVDVKSSQVESFLVGELGNKTKETAWRYVRLLERVYDHLVTRGFLQVNPVTDWVQARISAGQSPKVGRESPEPTVVTLADVGRIQDWLYTKGKSEMRAGNWRAARDVTLASVSLGTGMRCAELLVLSRKQVKHWPGSSADQRFEFNIPGWASVATARAHATQADVACVDLMEQWWAQRWTGFAVPSRTEAPAKNVLPEGELLFPASLKGGSLDPSTLFKNLKRLAKSAVADGALCERTQWVLTRGAQGLRRAYVLTEIEAGTTDPLLAYRMGLWFQRSVRRYREQLDGLSGRASAKRKAPAFK